MTEKHSVSNYKEELSKALFIRLVESRLLELFREGKIRGTVHTCTGQEYGPVFLSKYLLENDFVFSNHRGHGHYLAKTNDARGLISEILGRKTGISGGYGGSQHLFGNNFLSSGIQGASLPVAAGYACAQRMHRPGCISVVWIGDGTLGQGVLYETLNLLALWQLPVLIVVEQNGMAQSTPTATTISGSVADRVQAFGLKYFSTDSQNLGNLDLVCGEATSYVRKNLTPAVLGIQCARLNAHSKGDDNRSEKVIHELYEKDVIHQAIRSGLLEEDLVNRLNTSITELVQNILNDPILEVVEEDQLTFQAPGAFITVDQHEENNSFLVRLNKALLTQLETKSDLLVIGEDIEDQPVGTEKIYGGAFKVTRGLSSGFNNRVRNTPISESAITGFALGYALSGHPCIVEIMFGDFITLAADQLINNAAKMPAMFGRPVDLPFIVRTPMGGRRGYGPTHSQSLEKLFIGFPKLQVISLNAFSDPSLVFEGLLHREVRLPTVIIENKLLYGSGVREIPSWFHHERTGNGICFRRFLPGIGSADWLIFGHGFAADTALDLAFQLFVDYEIRAEVIVPELISPLDLSGMKEWIKGKKTLICIEEGGIYGSPSTQLITELAQRELLPARVRCYGNNSVIPASAEAEEKLFPTLGKIIEDLHQISWL